MAELLKTTGPFLAVPDGLRRCSRCGSVRALDGFPMKVKSRGLRRVWCRDCCRAYGREHYQRNTQMYLEKARRRRATMHPRIRALIDAYLREHPCVDCGRRDITVLEFDHRDPHQKEFPVGELARIAEWPRVLREIEKCDVRCANCHRMRTASQFRWAKLEGISIEPNVVRPGRSARYARLARPRQEVLFGRDGDGLRRCSRCGRSLALFEFAYRDLTAGMKAYYCRSCHAEYRRAHYSMNKAGYVQIAMREARLKKEDVLLHVFEYLRSRPCVDCGGTDIRVLEFDHIDRATKTMDVAKMIGRRNWTTIEAEIRKCDVRCANCHRKRTAAQQGWKCRLAETERAYGKMNGLRVWRSGSAQPSQG